MRKLSQQEIIQELLRTYQDVTSTLNAADDWIGEKPGSRFLVRPDNHPYFTGSYRMLEEILRYMRAGGRTVSHRDRKKLAGHYYAIHATYISNERRIATITWQHKRKGHKTETLTERRLVPITHRPIDPRDHDAGLNWIQQEFQHRHQTVWLPPEIHATAAA